MGYKWLKGSRIPEFELGVGWEEALVVGRTTEGFLAAGLRLVS
jgi:hypothetical protein